MKRNYKKICIRCGCEVKTDHRICYSCYMCLVRIGWTIDLYYKKAFRQF